MQLLYNGVDFIVDLFFVFVIIIIPLYSCTYVLVSFSCDFLFFFFFTHFFFLVYFAPLSSAS